MITAKELLIKCGGYMDHHDLPDDGRPLLEPIIITLEVVNNQANRTLDRKFVTVTVRNDEIHLAV